MDGSNAGERKRRAALLSLLASIGLTALKVVAGALSGSLALLSEGAHNAVDIAASGLTYLAVREADKPADAEHPFGHAKLEPVAALVETVALGVLAVGVLLLALWRLRLGPAALEVSALAQGQTIASPVSAASTTDFGSGSLTISFGSVQGSSFAADATRSPVTVTIAAGASLSDIANAITTSGAGLSAYVATNSNGQQLVISGPEGAANAFSISASESATDPGLAQFAYTPGAAGNGASLAEAASDASYTLNGVQRTSGSNSITDAAPGISLNLTGTNVGNPTTISFSDPTSQISTAMTNLVSALNSIASELGTDTAAGAALNNNPGARALTQALSSLSSTVVMPDAAPGAPKTLGDLGLTTNKDGSFTLDSTVLNNALHSNPAAVSAMFTTGINGVYSTIYNLSQTVNDPTDANSLAGSVKSLNTQQSNITTQLSTLSDEQTALRTQLINQFSALNSVVMADKSTQSFLTQQVALWTNSTTNG